MKNFYGTTQNFFGYQFQDYYYFQPDPSKETTITQPAFITLRMEIDKTLGSSISYSRGKVLDLCSRDADGDALHYIKFDTTGGWFGSQSFSPPTTGDINVAGLRVFFNDKFIATGAKLIAQTRGSIQTHYGPLQGTTVGSLYYTDFITTSDPSGPDVEDMKDRMWLFGLANNDQPFTIFVGTSSTGSKFVSLGVFTQEIPSPTPQLHGFISLVPKLSVATAINKAFSQDIITPTAEKIAVDITAEVDKNISSIYTSR